MLRLAFCRQAHSECSEAFYKTQIKSDIRSEPSKTAQEREKMLEVLARFEQESADDSKQLDEDDEDDDLDLAKRFDGIDIGRRSSQPVLLPS